MKKASFKKSFLEFCEKNKFEKNHNQINIVDELNDFVEVKKNFLNFFKPKKKLCFYLHGGVGLGKTMISDHFFNFIDISKHRSHFNEFMINFHNFKHENKSNSINKFVNKLKQYLS